MKIKKTLPSTLQSARPVENWPRRAIPASLKFERLYRDKENTRFCN